MNSGSRKTLNCKSKFQCRSRIYFCNLGMAIQLKKDSHLGGNLVQLVIILVTKKN